MGTLYAEGLHRFLESLSTYSRRRLTQAQRPDVDRIDHLPPALALRQRPPIPGPRSTVGTMSEVLNVLLSVNYDNAVAAVERSLRSNNERTRRLVQRFLVTRVCSVCHGTRLRPEALASQLGGRNLAEVSALSLGELPGFMADLRAGLPGELSRLTSGLLAELSGRLTPLLDVGLTYLTLDRAGASLSTGEPIGQNARSTPATYSGAFDQIRRVFAESAYARRRRWKPGHFSFNTREGQCPTCQGLGHIDLDVQYLPDITVGCPTCHGARFNDATLAVLVDGLTIADVLGLSVDDALERFAGRGPVAAALGPVSEVGLGYLRLGEPTPSLSGGESQRLRIASRLRSSQHDVLYVFDEPSTGLHPLDVATLAGVFDRLLAAGATVIVIDHDLDLLAAADHLIDVGPGGGPDGGRIVAAGPPEHVARDPGSVTGPWLAEHLGLP